MMCSLQLGQAAQWQYQTAGGSLPGACAGHCAVCFTSSEMQLGNSQSQLFWRHCAAPDYRVYLHHRLHIQIIHTRAKPELAAPASSAKPHQAHLGGWHIHMCGRCILFDKPDFG